MNLAIEAAREGIENGEYPFGCCIVRKDVVIVTNNTCFSDKNILHHAEMNAIQKAIEIMGQIRLTQATIYATVEPCMMCMGAINWAHIQRLVYGIGIEASVNTNFKEVSITSRKAAHYFPYSIEIVSGVCKKQCDELLEMWKKRGV